MSVIATGVAPLINVPFAAGVDFHEVKEDVTFPAQTESINVSITLGPNDIFPGEDKVFEVYVGPTPGTYVSPTAYVTVIIVDPDPELPGKALPCTCTHNE